MASGGQEEPFSRKFKMEFLPTISLTKAFPVAQIHRKHRCWERFYASWDESVLQGMLLHSCFVQENRARLKLRTSKNTVVCTGQTHHGVHENVTKNVTNYAIRDLMIT